MQLIWGLNLGVIKGCTPKTIQVSQNLLGFGGWNKGNVKSCSYECPQTQDMLNVKGFFARAWELLTIVFRNSST